ncbi:vesicle coat component [Ptychographa xylographoides]|nr:vesicle coat component [Ptychographa xylographoides]
METELSPSLSSSAGVLGSWHPARRPETEPSTLTQEDEETKTSFFGEPRAIADEVPQAISGRHAQHSQMAHHSLQPQSSYTEEDDRDAHSLLLHPNTEASDGGEGFEVIIKPNATITSAQREEKREQTSPLGGDHLGVSWQEESQVDPAWGIDSEAFKIGNRMQFNHTNSFPAVPLLHSKTHASTTQALSHSQVEDIMEDMEEEGAGEVANYDTPIFASVRDDGQPEPNFFAMAMMERKDSSVVGTNGYRHDHSPTLADEVARFEEGLPLMNIASMEQAQPLGLDNELTDIFGREVPQGAGNEEFYTNLRQDREDDTTLPKRSQLDRKSTSRVLASIEYPQKAAVHEDLPDDEICPNLDKIDSGFTISTGTNPSHAITDKVEKSVDSEIGTVVDRPAAEDDNLAAMWQEALADDDFLEEDSSVDPTSFFDEDVDGFLDETTDDNAFKSQNTPPVPEAVTIPYGQMQGLSQVGTVANHTAVMGARSQTLYSPQHTQAPSSSLGHPASAGEYSHAQTGLLNASVAPSGLANGFKSQQYSNQASFSRPGIPEKTQSFADKSKGGYTSPYDLPMDVSRPKKRAVLQHLHNVGGGDGSSQPVPPPRSTSIQSNAMSPYGQGAYQQSLTTNTTPDMSPSMSSPMSQSAFQDTLKAQQKPSNANFFEELPITSKPRPSSSAGRFVPPAYQTTPPPPQYPPQRAHFEYAPQLGSQPSTAPNVPQPYQLLPPERVLPYAMSGTSAASNPQSQNVNARYSPVPQGQPDMLSTRNRYAAPPIGPHRPPSVSQVLAHQPRTSSPLARSASATNTYRLSSQSETSNTANEMFPTGSRRPSLRSTQTAFPTTSSAGNQYQQTASLPPVNALNPLDMNPTYRAMYQHPLQETQLMSPDNRTFDQQTAYQSESRTLFKAEPDLANRTQSQTQRQAAIDDQTSHKSAIQHPFQQSPSYSHHLAVRRTSLAGNNFVVPTDGLERDALERWKGCPVFNFGFGGNIVTSFPKQIPRYGAGQLVPMIKCVPGEVKVRNGKFIPLEEHIATFPGPLKSKGKKKEVLSWLEKGIERLGQQHVQQAANRTHVDSPRRREETILLWKVLYALVENDGTLDGTPTADEAARKILNPDIAGDIIYEQRHYEPNSHSRDVSRSSISRNAPAAIDLEAVAVLRRLLLEGEREKAVWHAVDKQMWGHAMLMASTLQRDIWKQVAQEFVRLEVKSLSDKPESLAALYDIFAGNWEEIVDELVPPSARAGLQMVSKTAGSGSAKNALEGLDQWRETLRLVLSNRTPDDGKAMMALGRLLSGYGRVEAAHTCYIFSKAPGILGGADDPQASISLLGADHTNQNSEFGRDLDSVLLTEVYEFALTILAPSTASTIAPHLQAHKLHHAMVLAEYGYRAEAQQYCDAITSAFKATTKLSPYYHSQLFSSLEDLNSRLRQAPKDGSSSWIAKPSMDKVSGSVWNRFNQFISGDDSDAASTGSGKGIDADVGPFARIAGDTPSISRAQSPDLYGSYGSGGSYVPPLAAAPQLPANARYAPSGSYIPRSSLEQHPQRLPEAQRISHMESLKKADLNRQSSYSSLPNLSPDMHKTQQPDLYEQDTRPSSATFPPQPEKYSPAHPSQSAYSSESIVQGRYGPYPSGSESHNSQLTPNITHDPPSIMQHTPSDPSLPVSSPYEKQFASYPPTHSPSLGSELSASFKPASASYEPRSASYEPRSYQPSPVLDKPLPAAPYSPSAPHGPQSSYEPPSYEPNVVSLEPSSASLQPSPSYSYEPPSNSYDPPGYDPETQDDETLLAQEQPRKKSYLDDDSDDDLASKAIALKKAERAKKDKEADEAFKRAAEADAQKDSAPTTKSSWISWLAPGSKSKDTSSSAKAGPIKARLGEDSSFVYDDVLKKWVNKKAGAEQATASAPTPPPPKGPPSRAASAAGGPPVPTKPVPAVSSALSPGSGPPSQGSSRNASPALRPTDSPITPNAPTSRVSITLPKGTDSPVPEIGGNTELSGPAAGLSIGPPSAPPSRPTTGMSNASSIDDLIGAPTTRKGGTVKAKKKGRGYVDVMTK